MAAGRSDNDPAQIQRRLQHLRATLLDGRGPGVSAGEIALYTRQRPMLGTKPVAEALEELAERTSIARRDPDAVRDVVRQRRAELAHTIDVLTAKTRPEQMLRAGGRALRPSAAGAVTVLAVAAAVIATVRRRDGRPTRR